MMKKLIESIAAILFICGVLVLVDYHRQTKPRFKVGDCVRDSIQNRVRKVRDVGSWVYKYCLMRDNECSDKKYTMRIKDFDRLMQPTACPEVP